MSLLKTVVVIAGPTAVGKTRVAIEIGKLFSTEIISADSRQCYKEMKIGVARPEPEELAAVPHHFIASHSIEEQVNAAVFERFALEKARGIFNKEDVVVVVGGTGLYIKTFCEGLDEIPEVPEQQRQEIISNFKLNGLQWLQEQVKELDPEFFRAGETQNPQRLMRALEVARATGRSILSYRKRVSATRDFRVIKIALEKPKDELHQRIERRVDVMMKVGLLEEVKALMPFQHLNALQTVGYKEVFEHLNGSISLEEAVAQIKKHTRHYAKRQLTWFRKDPGFSWFDADDVEKIKEHLQDALLK